MIDVRRIIILEIKSKTYLEESAIEETVTEICGDVFPHVNSYGNMAEIQVELCDNDFFEGKNPAEERQAELIKAFKEKGYEVIA